MRKFLRSAALVVSTIALAALIFILASSVSGCQTVSVCGVEKATNVSAVVIGMDNSAFAGTCPGAGYDARRMRNLLSHYTDDVAFFADETATHDAVLAALKRASASELCIIFYSGHGGSRRFNDTGPEEADGQDEYLCLYDTYLRDNEIWKVIEGAKGRVFILADCCHAQTIFRVPQFTLRRAVSLGATHHDTGSVNMLCWSGCPDNTYSYGNVDGGQFTNTLLKYFAPNKTYDYLWTEIENDTALQCYEYVQRTVIGGGFAAKPIFR